MFLAFVPGQTSCARKLAIEFLRNQRRASEQDLARFVREMEISAQLKHVFIVDCVDCGEEDGQAFIAMPYCSGGNLAKLFRRTGKLNLRRALRLLDRLLVGVEPVHALLTRTEPHAWIIRDNKSLNGVWLRVTRAIITDSLQIQLGGQRSCIALNHFNSH